METNKNKFKISYTAPSKDERDEIEGIRKRYLPKKKPETFDERIKLLKKLDNQAHLAARIVASIMGIAGFIMVGIGMTMFLAWDSKIPGALVALGGALLLALLIPVYQFILKIVKPKYAERILKLSEELLDEVDNEEEKKEEESKKE